MIKGITRILVALNGPIKIIILFIDYKGRVLFDRFFKILCLNNAGWLNALLTPAHYVGLMVNVHLVNIHRNCLMLDVIRCALVNV